MLEVHPLVMVLLGETAGALFIVLVVWAFLALRKASKDKRAIQTLIANVNENSDSRKGELTGFLKSCQVTDDALEERLTGLLNAEKTFLQAFIKLYKQRDADAVKEFHIPLGELTTPYRALVDGNVAVPPPPPVAPPETEEDSPSEEVGQPVGEDADKNRIQELEQENARLTQELEITRNTLDNMLSEYASMFSPSGEETSDAVLLGDDTPGDQATENAEGDLFGDEQDDDPEIINEREQQTPGDDDEENLGVIAETALSDDDKDLAKAS